MRYSGSTIASAASQSSAVDLGDGDSILSIEVDGWTAAAITFLADPAGDGVFQPVYDEAGAELTIAAANVAASRVIVLNATIFAKLGGQIKFRSGTLALPVVQAANRVITVSLGKRYI